MASEKPFRDLIDKIAKEHNYSDYSVEVTPISTGGANYSSVIYSGTISAPNKEDLHLFAKTAALNAKIREEPVALYDTERFAYEELAKTFKAIEEKHNIPEEDRLVLSKYYGSNPKFFEETLVLENLSAQGYILYDRLKSVDWPYASKAVEVLAKFHALAMCLAEEDPEKFQKYCDEFMTSRNFLADGFRKSIDAFLPISLEAVNDENKGKFKAFFDKEENKDMHAAFNPVRKTVFAHGDYRPSNIMHRNNEDGSVDLIPVDLQTIMPSSGVIDLVYFIFTGTDGAFRNQYYTKLVEHYYASLSASLRSFGLNPEMVYPREDFDFELQEERSSGEGKHREETCTLVDAILLVCEMEKAMANHSINIAKIVARLKYGLFVAAFLLPIVTVDPADSHALSGDDVDFNNLQMKTGKTLSKRLNDVVDDYIKWGIL